MEMDKKESRLDLKLFGQVGHTRRNLVNEKKSYSSFSRGPNYYKAEETKPIFTY